MTFCCRRGGEHFKEERHKLVKLSGDKWIESFKELIAVIEKEVRYLGHIIGQGSRRLNPEQVAGILSIPPLKTKREVRKLLGPIRYCRLWVEGYTQLVKFLYEKLVQEEPLKWSDQDEVK